MSDELNEIVDNITQPSAWIRVLFMTLFAVASYFVLLPLILVLSIAQALFALITGKDNANLRYFAATLELYISQLIKFMTYISEVKPYPFSDLPEVEDDSLQEKPAPKKSNEEANEAAASTTSAVEKKPAAKRKTVKKKAAKKKAAKKAPKATEKPEADTGSGDVSDS
ncbi:MAG: glucose-1-phosphate thymidylyltransferase [SAR86 cluster bacterium]|uniref:Glucose-1-phosphate thymidylyltransferase n=1 Tax=SAR86 cluster bacterium TaxID=2030880 RepID=A0A2A4X9M7_9GAMM|nr:MAG: glucose-1-phosphate thymidylyltransferase [SAR86 cluster bacterium]